MTTMGGRSNSKLNSLFEAWRPNTIATARWLERFGVYRQLADKYVSSGWITRLGSGAYARAGDQVDWLGAVQSLQLCDELAVHPGGVTALGLLGYGHFVQGDREVVWLFGPPRTKLPRWFVKHDWNADLRYRPTALFDDHSLGLTQRQFGKLALEIATAERAMLEVLHHVPHEHSVGDAMALMIGLTTVRPNMAQDLMQACRSVKAKRLFLLMAEKAGHRWVDELHLDSLDLGSGKRVLGKGGHYYPEYQLSLPEALTPGGEAA